MKCNYCGSEMQETDAVCPFCGTHAGASSPVERREGVSENGEKDSFEKSNGEKDRSQANSSDREQMAVEVNDSGESGKLTVGETGSGESEEPAVREAGSGVGAGEGSWLEGAGSGGTEGKKKSSGKILVIGACIATVLGLGVFGATRLMEKDPKEIVIAAFENVYPEDQVKPMEELFGLSEFQENASNNSEANFKITLDQVSDETANQAAGVGIRTGAKYDREQRKVSGNLGFLYNNMDVVNLNLYYGDETVMVSIPELSGKVFTLDLTEGLAERLENSPLLGPALANSDMDVKGLELFFREYTEWIEKKAEDAKAGDPYGFRDAWNRYKNGCEASENFKAALTVEKAEKAVFQMDGKEENCRGYRVLVSKDDMISFLRTSSDFFLQDPELKENFLENLKMSMRLLELTGEMEFSAMAGKSPEDVLNENYEEAKEFVDEAIEELDKSLNDIEMLVHVDKNGRLASVWGTTSITNEDENIQLSFTVLLQGGSYLTQNAVVKVEAESETQTAAFELVKSGTYDGKQLTGDISIDCAVDDENLYFVMGGSYEAEGGDLVLQGEVGSDGQKIIGISAVGIISELEKGTTLHMDLDEIRMDVPGNILNSGFNLGGEEDFYAVFSGEYDLRPLSAAIEELPGEKLDVVEATEEDWQRVFMEAYMGAMDIMNQLGPMLNGN